MGLLRTRLDAILPAARIGGRSVPLAPELFAIMADARLAHARLALGQISAERYSCDTADGAGKDRQSALRRLARCVCADLEEIGEAGALAIAGQACSRQKKILVAAISRQAEKARPGEARCSGDRRGPDRRGCGIPGDGARATLRKVWDLAGRDGERWNKVKTSHYY